VSGGLGRGESGFGSAETHLVFLGYKENTHCDDAVSRGQSIACDSGGEWIVDEVELGSSSFEDLRVQLKCEVCEN